MRRINEILKENKITNPTGNTIDFGFTELTGYLSEINKNGTITLFGHPAMGKTSFMLNLVNNICKQHDCSILYIATEDSEETLSEALLSIESEISLRKIAKKFINEMEIEHYEKTLNKVSNYSLYVLEHFNKFTGGRLIEYALREFIKDLEPNRKKIVIFDQYYRNPEILEKVRKYTKNNNTMLFIIAPEPFNRENPTKIELKIDDLDLYLNLISDCVISIYRPAYFTTRIDDDSAYVSILKHPRYLLEEIKFKFNRNNLKFTEEYVVDDIPFDLDEEIAEWDDIPF